ncbi:hypothetical protein HDU99_005926 [Rhizoclosmatium hyalinum]|nr:hypothetical protein HDU99_005926 [Rhizoclosmatium hyalinum]
MNNNNNSDLDLLTSIQDQQTLALYLSIFGQTPNNFESIAPFYSANPFSEKPLVQQTAGVQGPNTLLSMPLTSGPMPLQPPTNLDIDAFFASLSPPFVPQSIFNMQPVLQPMAPIQFNFQPQYQNFTPNSLSSPSTTTISSANTPRDTPTPATSSGYNSPTPASTPTSTDFNNNKTEEEQGFEILATFPVIPQTRRHRNPKSKEYTRTDRFRASDSEVALLNAVFSASPFPSVELREAIAAKLGLTSTQVRFWFQNRRVQLKKQGVHVIKPRKGGVLGYAGALKPVEGASPFFFVEDLK